MSSPSTFFESSQSITDRLAELNNFTWPTVAALWNLRWQVQGFAAVTGKREVKELHERFVAGSGVTSANLKVACLETTWEAQQEQFARFLLFELCGLFEAWLEEVVPRAISAGKVRTLTKCLQFPSGLGQKASGLAAGLAVIKAERSTLMHKELLPTLQVNPKNSWANIEPLLRAYRHFKECRNSFIHHGGKATQACADAHKLFASIPLSALYFKRAPIAPPVTLGDRITLPLHDVVGLSSIVHRLVVTLDATLASTIGAEADMLTRLRASADPNLRMLSKNPVKRERQLASRLRAARIPKPHSTALLEPWFFAHKLTDPSN
jgi:hypothetical protein